MNFISIGGWCGTKIALKDLGLFNEPSLPFDSVRTSMEGVIDCIEHNFQHFFPNEIKKDDRYPYRFVGEYVGFYHENHNLFDPSVIESFERKFVRFDEKIKKNNCVFLRTIARENYYDEILYYKKLQEVLDRKYPNLSYIVCFIIPNQPTTQYFTHLDDRTFLFTVNDRSGHVTHLKDEYKPIFDFIQTENLFTSIPHSNDIQINDLSNRLWLVNGYPMVDYLEKTIDLLI
jgi:hypothetical protein